ncbi:MAG: regulatory protein RecX [archaeon]|nr:regulatory protein RecX [archaeon]
MENKNKLIESALTLVMKYLSYRPRSVYEIKIYLKKKGFDQAISRQVIAILLEKKYLNDRDFTTLYIETMVRNKPKSKFAIGFELKKKGIDPLIIEPALEQFDDQCLAMKAVNPKIKIWKNLDKEKFKKKLMYFLQYRGFNYDVCMTTLNSFKHLQVDDEN